MTTLNTDYNEQVKGFAGQLADMAQGKYAVSMVQGDVASIPFGAGVVDAVLASQAGGADSAKLPTGATVLKDFRGVVLHSNAYDKLTELDTVGVLPGAMLSVLKKGVCFVTVETAVAKGDALYLRITANGALNPGGWRNDVDGGKAIACPAVVADETLLAGGVCRVIVDTSNAV
jgi:hypothetical protein